MKTQLSHLLLTVLLLNPVVAFTQQWQWAHEVADYSSNADIEGCAVATDVNDNVYAAGAFYGDTIVIGGSTLISAGGSLYVVKYDAAGTVLWAKTDGGYDVSTPHAIAVDASSDLFVATSFLGDSAVFGSTVLYNAGSPNQDICMVKYDTNGNILWAISAGTTADEWVESASVDPHGNFLVTGSFKGATLTLGSFTLTNTNPGSEDIFLAKLDPNGIVLWAVKAGGSNYDWPTGVSCDGFGNTVISGVYFSDSLIFNGSTALVSPYGDNHDQLFVAKYDSIGVLSWARQVTLTSQGYDSYFYDAATDPYGNVFAIGSCISDTIFADTLQLTGSPTSFRDMLIVKYSSGGLLQWARREIGVGEIYGFDLAVNSSGEAYATGYFNCDSIVFGTDTTLIIDQWFWSDMFLAKYNQTGSVEWATNVGGTYMPGSWGYKQFGVACTDDGKVAVSGTFDNDNVAFGSSLLMLNNSWPNTYIAVINDADSCDAAFTLVADTAMQHHYWIINQATGTSPLSYLWDWGDGLTDTAAYPSHIYPTAAYYTICLTITDPTGCTDIHCFTDYLNRSSESAMVAQVNVVATIPTGINETYSSQVRLYPNPAQSVIYFETGSEPFSADNLMVSDVAGRIIALTPRQVNATKYSLDISSLSNGIYFVQIHAGEQIVRSRFIKN
ncbi:MAG TPA: T9SS type A sorting domain-containing protein [Bacteroidia bacterium]|nr:T9SS type A sorting domain-containing protein [Bacteroidia bacterium]